MTARQAAPARLDPQGGVRGIPPTAFLTDPEPPETSSFPRIVSNADVRFCGLHALRALERCMPGTIYRRISDRRVTITQRVALDTGRHRRKGL